MSEMISTQTSQVDDWRRLIVKQAGSAQTISDFCRDHQINFHSFKYWRARLGYTKQHKVPNMTAKNLGKRFVAISHNGHQPPPRIVLPNGVTIDLGCSLDSISARQFLLTLCGVGFTEVKHAKS